MTESTIETKPCKDCGVEYPVTREFFGQYKNKRSNGEIKIGHRNSCRKCMAKTTAEHHQNNKHMMYNRLEKRKRLEEQAEGSYSDADIERIRQLLENRCFFCDRELGGGGEVEHLTPISRGGSNYPDNLTLSCSKCNKEKTNKTLAEYVAWRNERKLHTRKAALRTATQQ
jgi:5-methylcytosine-specific restriction endonuclease McrA